MINYASLTITKITSRSFTIDAIVIKNGLEVPIDQYEASQYTGVRMGDYIYIKTGTGANSFLQVPYNVITYIDTILETNETFTDPAQVVTRLKEVGFFVDSTAGGGGGGTDTFKELLDVNVSTFTGRAGYSVVVDSTGTYLELAQRYSASRMTELLDWIGGALEGNKYIITTAVPPYRVAQADIDQVINKPIPVDTFRVVAKGVNPDTGNPNLEDFIKEVGDWCEGVSGIDGKYYTLIYLGGDDTDIESYEITGWKRNPNIN